MTKSTEPATPTPMRTAEQYEAELVEAYTRISVLEQELQVMRSVLAQAKRPEIEKQLREIWHGRNTTRTP